MGYNTNYQLQCNPMSDELDLALDANKPEGCLGSLMGFVTGYGDDCTWYDWEDDMREFSCLFPEVLFTLEGRGDDQGDHWSAYIQAGKVQVCKARITFEDYDPEKMK